MTYEKNRICLNCWKAYGEHHKSFHYETCWCSPTTDLSNGKIFEPSELLTFSLPDALNGAAVVRRDGKRALSITKVDDATLRCLLQGSAIACFYSNSGVFPYYEMPDQQLFMLSPLTPEHGERRVVRVLGDKNTSIARPTNNPNYWNVLMGNNWYTTPTNDLTFLDHPDKKVGDLIEPTCKRCGKAMRFNVPRLGPDGGFIHADSGKFLCADLEDKFPQQGIYFPTKPLPPEGHGIPSLPSGDPVGAANEEANTILASPRPPEGQREQITCPKCRGGGQLSQEPCWNCNGEGVVDAYPSPTRPTGKHYDSVEALIAAQLSQEGQREQTIRLGHYPAPTQPTHPTQPSQEGFEEWWNEECRKNSKVWMMIWKHRAIVESAWNAAKANTVSFDKYEEVAQSCVRTGEALTAAREENEALQKQYDAEHADKMTAIEWVNEYGEKLRNAVAERDLAQGKLQKISTALTASNNDSALTKLSNITTILKGTQQ